MDKKIRVLVSKVGLDGHDRGVKVIAYGLRDAGFEVIFLGIHHTPDQVADTAIQEDVDVVGLSILSGAHMHLTQKVIEKLRDQGGDDIFVVVGGVIPEEDKLELMKIGVGHIFTSGTDINRVVQVINDNVNRDR
ncbi:MAG: cobalamin B12-binding domain-containing protein [Desulfobacterales bacterium]